MPVSNHIKPEHKLILILALSAVFIFHQHARAQSTAAKKTKQIIDSILHNPYKTIKKEFFPEYPHKLFCEYHSIKKPAKAQEICYARYYYSNGNIKREGLSDEHYFGVWFYYDTTGKLYKEYDFDIKSKKLYGITEEPWQKAFDSVTKMTLRFAERHFGAEMYKKYVKVQGVYWNDGKVSDYSNILPDQPLAEPAEYFASVHLVYNDSVDGARVELKYNRDLSYKESSLPNDDTAGFYPVINVGYTQALRIAKKNNFKGFCYLSDWDQSKNTYYWVSSRSTAPKATGPASKAWNEKTIRIDARTGVYNIETKEMGSVGHKINYDKKIKDTFRLKQGWKTVEIDDLLINTPLSFQPIELYYSHIYKTTKLLLNRNDTLVFNSYCAEKIDEPIPKTDSVLAEKFDKAFPLKTIQQRDISAILYSRHGKIRVKIRITEKDHADDCPMFYYDINAIIDPVNLDSLFEILKTIRFRFSK